MYSVTWMIYFVNLCYLYIFCRMFIYTKCKPLEEKKACVLLRSYIMLFEKVIKIPLLPYLISDGVMSLKMQRYVLQPKTHDQRISQLLSILETRENGLAALLSWICLIRVKCPCTTVNNICVSSLFATAYHSPILNILIS